MRILFGASPEFNYTLTLPDCWNRVSCTRLRSFKKNLENSYPQLCICHPKRERSVVTESMFSKACSRISNVAQDNQKYLKSKLNSVAVVRKRTIPTKRPPLVGKVSANLCGKRVLRGQRNEFPRPLISVF
jgi:hypothetical protein